MSHSQLPLDLTSFVGRASELDRLADLLTRSRLVTLTGGPGIGKTRLALQLVRERVGPDRPLAWVPLAGLREPRLVVPAVARAVQPRDEVGPDDVEGLARLIGDRELLLLLDNCEHLVDAVAGVVDALLRACPGLTVLATSREALGVRGERAWLVPPMDVPAGDEGADATTSEAVDLFVERAREVAPDFALTPSTELAVREICRRLDGIPLAIELAAARIRMLQPRDMLGRLDDVFGLLNDDRRTSVPRHRTLRAAIDWSHELLEEPSRVLLARLSVFRGGLTLGAAEEVGAGGALAVDDVLELVGRLVDRSLLVVRERDGFARYHLLEAVRQYASEKLRASGEEHETRLRHARYLFGLVEQAAPHLVDRDRRVWVDRLRPETNNLRSALEWTREEDPELHVRLVGGLWWFWFSTQHWAEAARWIAGALELDAARAPGPERAALLFASGALAALQVRTLEARPRRPTPTPSTPAPVRPGSGADAPPLVVDALGRFRVAVDGATVDDERWPYAKPRELLVHLLLHPAGRTRDQIGEALWPGAPRSNVKNSFHVTLHHLRKALGHPEWIGIEGERYRLSPNLEPVFDASVFEAEARRALEYDDAAELRSAIARFRGELLEGDTVGRWIDEHRERLRRLYVELHLALGALLEETDPSAAASTYRGLVASEELDEEIHRRLMSCLARAGDRAGALRHFERLETLLERTLDAAPERETRALYDRIRSG